VKFILLGRGAYGQVYKGENTLTGEIYALKMIDFYDKSQGVPSYLLREMSALQQLGELNHPNIVKLLDII
jgi:serine/threonine protein kinase